MNPRAIFPILLLVAVLAGPTLGQEYAVDRSSPRATVMTLIHALNDVKRGHPERIADAVHCLDLSEIAPVIRDRRGVERAWDLLEVLDRGYGRIDEEKLPAQVATKAWLMWENPAGRIVLVLGDDGQWLFGTETVAAIPDLYQAVKDMERDTGLTGSEGVDVARDLRRRLPDWMREKAFLLEHYQWFGLLLLILVGIVTDRLLTWIVGGLVQRRLRRERIETDKKLRKNALRPLGLLAMALTWWVGLDYLLLPDKAYEILLIAAKGLAVIAAVWSAYRLVDLVMDYFRGKADKTETRIDDVLVPLLRKTLKVFISAFGLVFIADNLNVNVASLLAGLGLGGLAFALAARETVANLFGSVTVLLDRPFDIGDWVRIGDVDGNVEKIGFRSTRIRTFYNSQITVPNSQLITATCDNMGARRYRRIKTMLSLTYGTPPEKIDAFCEGVRELIRRHPYTRKDYYHVYLNALGASSLDVLLYCFVETPDWATELREKHRLYSDILRLADRLGVDFAFPTQTLHLEKPAEVAPEPGEASGKHEIDAARREGRIEAAQIVQATLPDGRRPPPVVLGAKSLDPELEQRNVGGEEG